MTVFLSYANEDRPIAEKIALALRNDGHKVFFDKHDMVGGEDFDARIRDSIAASERFIFLLSRFALDAGSYTLTELRFARERWPGASGAVLPVIIDKGLHLKDVPVYLTSVHVFQPEGNIPAETVNEVAKGATVNRLCKTCMAVAAAAVFGGSVFLANSVIGPLLQPVDVAITGPSKINFRPVKRPVSGNPAWLDAEVTLTAIGLTYAHRTEPAKKARIENEGAQLQLGEQTIPFRWLYFVDIRNDCKGSDWLCAIGPAEATTLDPGQIVSRQTMFQPKESRALIWKDLISMIMESEEHKLIVSVEATLDIPSGAKPNSEIREVRCEIDLAALKPLIGGYIADRGKVPSWFQPSCMDQ